MNKNINKKQQPKTQIKINLPSPMWSSTSIPFNCEAINLACSWDLPKACLISSSSNKLRMIIEAMLRIKSSVWCFSNNFIRFSHRPFSTKNWRFDSHNWQLELMQFRMEARIFDLANLSVPSVSFESLEVNLIKHLRPSGVQNTINILDDLFLTQ